MKPSTFASHAADKGTYPPNLQALEEFIRGPVGPQWQYFAGYDQTAGPQIMLIAGPENPDGSRSVLLSSGAVLPMEEPEFYDMLEQQIEKNPGKPVPAGLQ